MKKTPLLLSTLALAAGVTGSINMALSLASPVAAIEALTDSEQNTDIYFEDLSAMNEYFRIEGLNFKKNSMTYNVNKYTVVGGMQAQKVLIVARDYEAGVSEAEADEKSHFLGVDGDTTWYKSLVNNRVVASTNYVPNIKDYKLEDNLTDILYFAIQFGEIVTDTNGKKTLKDAYWVRGKIDYRKCIHSALFDAETMTCSTMVEYPTKTATLVTIDSKGDYVIFPEDEKVITWDEEWGGVLKDRLATLDAQITHMNTQLPAVEATLAQMAATIKNIQKLAGELDDAQEVEQSLEQTKALSQQVQNTYDWMLGTEQRKIMDDLRAALAEALAEIEQLKQQQSTDNTDEILQYQQALEKLQKEITELQAELSKVNTQLRLETINLANTEQELAQMEAKMREILAEKEGIMQKIQDLMGDKGVLEKQNDDLNQENAKISAENSVFVAKVTDLTKQNTELQEQNQNLIAQIRELQEQNRNLVAQFTESQEQNQDLVVQNEVLNAKIKELETALAEKPTCTVITEMQVDNKAMEDADVVNNLDAVVEDKDDTASVEAVEVPNLGEVKTKTNFWWMIAGLAIVLGAIGVYCKKHLNRER